MANEINDMDQLNALIGQADAAPAAAPTQTIVDEPIVAMSEDEAPAPAVEAPVAAPVAPAAPVANAAETKRKILDNILSSINVDLSSINIVKSSNPLGTHAELENLFLKPSYDVIALQSGYRAAFKALNNDDMIKVRKFSGTEREQNLKLFTFVYSKMVNSNLGKITFEDWMKITSEADFETLVYGIYCATFPEEQEYTVGCQHCGKENKAKISKEWLIQAKDEAKVGGYIRDLLGKNYAPNELVKHSVVNNKVRVMLPKSKIIMDLVTPTLADYIRTISRAETNKGVEPEIFGYLKHIGDIFIPHIQALAEGRADFLQLESIEDKIRTIVNVDPEDKKHLDKAINDKMGTYKVEYKLPDLNCRHCEKEVKDITVDMTEVLFQNIAKATVG
jgi:hypothetical protein